MEGNFKVGVLGIENRFRKGGRILKSFGGT